MISQEQINEATQKFCNLDMPFYKASEIATQLNQLYQSEQAVDLLINNSDLYRQLEGWHIVESCLSFSTETLDKQTFDDIEDKLVPGVPLQVYFLHMRLRLNVGQHSEPILSKKELRTKLKAARFALKHFVRFLEMYDAANPYGYTR